MKKLAIALLMATAFAGQAYGQTLSDPQLMREIAVADLYDTYCELPPAPPYPLPPSYSAPPKSPLHTILSRIVRAVDPTGVVTVWNSPSAEAAYSEMKATGVDRWCAQTQPSIDNLLRQLDERQRVLKDLQGVQP